MVLHPMVQEGIAFLHPMVQEYYFFLHPMVQEDYLTLSLPSPHDLRPSILWSWCSN